MRPPTDDKEYLRGFTVYFLPSFFFFGGCTDCAATLASDVRYLGPMPLAQSHRFNEDTRDGGRRERNGVTGNSHGAFRCHYAGECSRVCPKGVDPAKAIQFLKRRLVLDFLHLSRKKEPCKKLEGPGSGTLLPDIPTAPKYTVISDK